MWDFLRDPENRAALELVGALIAAVAIAGWAVWRELRMSKKIGALAGEIESHKREIERLKDAQGIFLGQLERSHQRHDLLFSAILKLDPHTEDVDRNGKPSQ